MMDSKICLLAFVLIFVSIGPVCAQSVASQYVDPHNAARREVNVPDLKWDQDLAQFAQNYANSQASKNDCRLTHSDSSYGENLYWTSANSSPPSDAVAAWVDEKKDYFISSNSCNEGKVCGHYTQVVWKSSQRVGCASASCPGGGTFVGCNYDPPGNYVGQKPY
ncbi:hypothetical protein Mapa_004198 [Marchantia paleacea]|nr:hypothetical protein Mapa_004198 [Marchantia paleacea]